MRRMQLIARSCDCCLPADLTSLRSMAVSSVNGVPLQVTAARCRHAAAVSARKGVAVQSTSPEPPPAPPAQQQAATGGGAAVAAAVLSVPVDEPAGHITPAGGGASIRQLAGVQLRASLAAAAAAAQAADTTAAPAPLPARDTPAPAVLPPPAPTPAAAAAAPSAEGQSGPAGAAPASQPAGQAGRGGPSAAAAAAQQAGHPTANAGPGAAIAAPAAQPHPITEEQQAQGLQRLIASKRQSAALRKLAQRLVVAVNSSFDRAKLRAQTAAPPGGAALMAGLARPAATSGAAAALERQQRVSRWRPLAAAAAARRREAEPLRAARSGKPARLWSGVQGVHQAAEAAAQR